MKYMQENKTFTDAQENLTGRVKSSFLEVPPRPSAYICDLQKSASSVLYKLEAQDELKQDVSQIFDLIAGDCVEWNGTIMSKRSSLHRKEIIVPRQYVACGNV